MKNGKVSNRLHNRNVTASYAEPGVALRRATAPTAAEKPGRIVRRDLARVLAVLRRALAGGDATLLVDMAECVPILERSLEAAPVGPRAGRTWFVITYPSGKADRVLGTRGVADKLQRSRSHVQNMLSQGKGRAEFPCRDEHGNPATIVVSRDA